MDAAASGDALPRMATRYESTPWLTALPVDRAVLRLLVGLVALDDPLGAEAPVVAQRLGAMQLGIEREFLMPGTRVEVAELLVLHLIHLAEDLDPHQVGIAVIGRDVVADDVAA